MIRPVLVRREAPLRGGQPLSFAVGLVVALTIGIVLLMGAGHDPLVVYERMFVAALGDPDSWAVTLNRAVPLGLAGLAVAIAGPWARRWPGRRSGSTRSSRPSC